MFATLTGEDLLELKISAFGARKRLLLAINQLKSETLSSSQLKSETPPSSEWIQLSDFKDIPSLFTHLEMGHHIGKLIFRKIKRNLLKNHDDNIKKTFLIENFIQNEIDLKTFVTLTSHDLTELGVKFIERKRLLLAINQLKSERFSGSAAPGAERRPSVSAVESKLFHIP